jgi:hypothetical protein
MTITPPCTPRLKRQRYIVPLWIVVQASSPTEANDEVRELVRYAFEVSNDDGKFKNFGIDDGRTVVQSR